MAGAHSIKLAVVGLGKMGLSHFAIANATSGIDVVAVSDSSKLLQEGFTRFIKKRSVGDFTELLDLPGLEAVVIATPTRLHYDMARTALERGLHVFCEKPLTLSGEQSTALTALANDRNRVAQVGYHNRFVGTFREVRRLLDAGAIGKVRHVHAEAYGPVVVKPTAATWRSRPEEGGGCLYDYAAHPVNLMNWYVGAAQECTGAELPEQFSSGVEDAVYATLRFADSVTGQVTVNWSDASHRKMTTQITIFGDAGKIVADRQELKLFLNGNAPIPAGYNEGWTVKYTTELTPPVGYYLRGEEYSAQIESFRDAIAACDTDPVNSFASAAETDRTLELIRNRYLSSAPLITVRPTAPAGKRGVLARVFGR